MEDLLVRYIHFIGIFLLVSMLIVENMLLSKKIDSKTIKKLAIIDGVYGASAVIVLVSGLLLWFYVGKPSSFYTSNGIFHAKITLFLLIALMSIVPTIFFLKNRNIESSEISVPKHILLIKHIEVVLVFVLPLLAVFMAQGYGAHN